jgi:hypothetical protein
MAGGPIKPHRRRGAAAALGQARVLLGNRTTSRRLWSAADAIGLNGGQWSIGMNNIIYIVGLVVVVVAVLSFFGLR